MGRTPALALLATALVVGRADAADDSKTVSAGSAEQAREQENWFQSRLRAFRTYPHLDLAYRLTEQGRLPEAKAELERYLTIDPKDDDVRLTYLLLLYRMKNFQETVRQADLLLKRKPHLAVARIYRGLALPSLGRPADAFADLQKVASDPAADKENRLLAANSAYSVAQGQHAPNDALAALSQVAALKPDFDVYTRRGNVLESIGRLDDAEEAHRTALQYATSSSQRLQVFSALGNLEKKRGDLPAAQKNFMLALELNTRNQSLMRSLADAAYLAKDYPQAVDWMRKYVAISATARDREFLANLLIAQKDDNAAAAELSRAIALATTDEDRARLSMNLGYTQIRLGQPEQAAAAFKQADAAVQSKQAESALVQTRSLEKKEQIAKSIRSLKLALERGGSADAALKLGLLYAAQGDDRQALHYLEQASRNNTAPELHQDLYRRYSALGDTKNALRHLEIAARSNKPELQLKLGTLYATFDENAKAIGQLEKALTHPLSSDQRQTVNRQLGYLYTAQNDHQAAAGAFRRAIAAGAGGARIHEDLGLSLYRLEQWNEAREQFSTAAKIESTPTVLIYIARCYNELKQPELAIQYFQLALRQGDQLNASDRKSMYDELGYLYTQQKQYAAAEAAWQQSLSLQQDPAITLRLGMTQHLQGKTTEALATLQSIPADTLTTELQAARADELAQIYQENGEKEQTINALIDANQLQPTAEREYRLGTAYLADDRADEAITHLEQAHQQQPSSIPYTESLAYAYNRKGRFADATRMFEEALARDPENVGMVQDVAYTYLRGGDNDNAARWFKQAVDIHYSALDAGGQSEQTADEDLYRMRAELNRLNKRFEFGLYQSYRARNNGSSGTASPSPFSTNGGAVPSQGGLEMLYQPPELALDIDRPVQLFTRLLWSNQPGSLSIRSESLQGGVGARIKPLKEHNLYLGLEKLFKVGNQSEDDWLLRGSYSWTDGYELKPNKLSWNLTTVYADAGYFTRSGITSLYAEARQGRTFNIDNALLVTPHLVVTGRRQRPDPFNGSYLEAGAGVSLKYLFNATRYETSRSSVDVQIQYKIKIAPQHNSGWVAAAELRF